MGGSKIFLAIKTFFSAPTDAKRGTRRANLKSTSASGKWNGFGGSKRAIETFSSSFFAIAVQSPKNFELRKENLEKRKMRVLKKIFLFHLLKKFP